jgi:hypothetical protein
MKATRCFLCLALVWEMWDFFFSWFCVYPCRRGIKIQQYVVHIVSSAGNVTCYIVKANEVWVKIVRQTNGNLDTYYFVLQVYMCGNLPQSDRQPNSFSDTVIQMARLLQSQSSRQAGLTATPTSSYWHLQPAITGLPQKKTWLLKTPLLRATPPVFYSYACHLTL